MIIHFCSAPCGSGKTYQLVKSACHLANSGETVLFLQPTKELIDKTIDEQLSRLSSPPLYEKFYAACPGQSVARKLTQYLKSPVDGGHIVFATHQVLPFVRFWANQNRVHVIIDEELQVAKHGCFQIPQTHKLITDYIELGSHDAVYSRVIASDYKELEKIASNPAKDEIFERFRETAQILVNSHWDSFVNTEQYEKLRVGKVERLSIHSILRPSILEGFGSVTMASANFRDTLVYELWSHQGVQFDKDKGLIKSLRFQEHQNGHLVSVKYLTDRSWSKKLQTRLCSSEDGSVLKALVQAVRNEFQDRPFLWQANKSVGDNLFDEHAQRLPNVPHGLNDYSDYDRIAFLSALNPRSNHFRFLESRGVDGNDVRRAIYCSAVYQSVMRTSIRDPQSTTPKAVIVPDISAAQYLQEAFPGSQVEKLETELIDLENSSKRGRPRKYSSRSEQMREYRQRKNESALKAALRLEKFPYVGQKSCCDEKGRSMIRDEKGIDITTHFVTHHACHGTLYRDKKSKTPLGYLSGGNSELFLGLLKHLHTRTVESKEGNLLISPAIFDPNHPKAEGSTQRGLKNIVAMRHVWMDFEKGDLTPEVMAELFPHVRLIVFNTYNHTSENSRFRVVIPFDEPISADDYGTLYDNLIAKIEDAGYSIGTANGGSRRSGLDVSKKSPTSLFYLPCQAKEPSDSFFADYNDDKRKILHPMTWVSNTVVHFPEVDTKGQPPLWREVDETAVAKATRMWRESRHYPGQGNDRLFQYAVAMRSAGMSLKEIERKLRDEAKFGRSPQERRTQVPSIMRTLGQLLKKSV